MFLTFIIKNKYLLRVYCSPEKDIANWESKDVLNSSNLLIKHWFRGA